MLFEGNEMGERRKKRERKKRDIWNEIVAKRGKEEEGRYWRFRSHIFLFYNFFTKYSEIYLKRLEI